MPEPEHVNAPIAAWPSVRADASGETAIAYEVDALFDAHPSVRLQRHVVCDDRIVASVLVWSLPPIDRDEAQRCREWLLARPDW